MKTLTERETVSSLSGKCKVESLWTGDEWPQLRAGYELGASVFNTEF